MVSLKSPELKQTAFQRLRSLLHGWTGGRAHANLLDSSVTIAMVGVDLAGRINLWNAGAERLLGWSREEATGMPVACLFTPGDQGSGAPEREIGRALASDSL